MASSSGRKFLVEREEFSQVMTRAPRSQLASQLRFAEGAPKMVGALGWNGCGSACIYQ